MTRRILITGAASGIGAATARAFAGPGAAMLLHTRRNQAGLDGVAAGVAARGGTATTMLGDLAEPDLPAALVAAAVERLGALDVVVSNAGFADRTPLAALTDAALAASTETISHAFLRLARAAIPQLQKSSAPRIIAVGSFVAHSFRLDIPLFPASAAAKAALEASVRALAITLAADGITVNAVIPGFIRKDSGAHVALARGQADANARHIPLGRLGEPTDIAAAILFLAGPEASYITGQALHVDGGLVMK